MNYNKKKINNKKLPINKLKLKKIKKKIPKISNYKIKTKTNNYNNNLKMR